ncbi:hypothetical protein J5X07_12685 [Actinomyces bowdenii]|uniref:hypothetical protein n=1 Tax=Actinomyces bowdenii TaxID=131109 RepID=UPI001ABCD4F8|nr:hypothetical protein [Actinomyces bowdenii]MBO3725865.1 hypothetical protein [Actinomyces bowdenii]
MSKDVLYGICALLMGVGTLINWWFEMFSDSPYAELCRSIMDSSLSLGRNTIALIEPALGACFFFTGILILTPKTSPLGSFLVPIILFFIVIAALGMLPIPLPRPMYPEWQMDKRRRLAAQAASATVDEDRGTTPSTLALKNYQSTPPQNIDHSSSYTLPIPDDELPSRSHHDHNNTPPPDTPI